MLTGTILKERYEVGEIVGNGGFATTYRGTDLISGDTVAVKECRNVRPKDLEKIRNESEILQQLSQSEGIVHIRDYVETQDAAYIIMDFAKGETLKSYIRQKGPMTPGRVLNMFLPVMKSLMEVHRMGLLHRDISPDNIMMESEDNLKLLDFGAAKSLADDDEQTMTLILKPGYAPEEQYRSIDAQGPWTDVYALCATMYFCITGSAPEDSLQRMYEDSIKKPSEYGIVIAADVEEILMHGLALRGENRIASMEDLMNELLGNEENHVQQNVQQNVRSVQSIPTMQKTQPVQKIPEVQNNQPIRKNRAKKSKADSKRTVFPKVFVAILVSVVFCIFVLGFMIIRRGNSSTNTNNDYPYFSEVKITSADISGIKKNKKVTSVTFDECELTDDQIKDLGEIDHVTSCTFYDCYGFTSLEGLAGCENIDSLTWSSYQGGTAEFYGAEIFPCEFPYLSSLSLSVSNFEGGVDFFEQFSHLTSLYVYNSASYDDDHGTVAMESIDFVSKINTLESFSVNDIQILSGDLSPLGACASLMNLTLRNCGLTSLEGLGTCSDLMSMDVQNNQITSLKPISECSRLYSLDASSNQLSSLEGVEELDELSSLYAGHNQLTGIKELESLKRITTLNVEANEITSLEGCESNVDMTQLNFDENKVNDLMPIKNCTSLSVLQARDNELSDISLLEDGFSELETVDIASNQVSDLGPLKNASGLLIFRGDNNQLTSLEGLEGKADLYAVSVLGNSISDLKPLEGLKKLQYLDLAQNKISDLQPLSSLEANDMVLFLEKNQIEDIRPLPTKNTYRMITLQGNPIADYSYIDKFLVETIYLPGISGADDKELISGHMDTLYLVDTDKGDQAKLKRDFKDEETYMNLLTDEEAEENMDDMREIQRGL